jgi:hypothetical protein
MALFFQVRKTTVLTEEQIWLYNSNNFIADVGGYLGLLLGFSCLSMYKNLQKWILRLFWRDSKTLS